MDTDAHGSEPDPTEGCDWLGLRDCQCSSSGIFGELRARPDPGVALPYVTFAVASALVRTSGTSIFAAYGRCAPSLPSSEPGTYGRSRACLTDARSPAG